MHRSEDVVPFAPRAAQSELDELRRRLRATVWPDAPAGLGWSAGVDLDALRDLVAHWADGFDWRAVEERLARLPRFRTAFDGLGIHFVHARARADGPPAMPLLLAHGWPDSFWRYSEVVPLLVDPGAHGADPADAFDDVADGAARVPAVRRRGRRRLGPSSLGDCREKLRATIAGDRMEFDPRFNAKTFVGTAVGDLCETALTSTMNAVTQLEVTAVLPSGIKTVGNIDVPASRKRLWDLKGKEGYDDTIQDGPSIKHKIQLASYFVGLVQQGDMDDDGIASLVFQDRSAKQDYPCVWSTTYAQAVDWLEVVDDRLHDAQKALVDAAYGVENRYVRDEDEDEDESYCWHIHCPFHQPCWPDGEYTPTNPIVNPRTIAAVDRYEQGRELQKAAKQLMDSAKAELGGGDEKPVQGASERFNLKFTLYERAGQIYSRIDLRWKRGMNRAGPTLRIREVEKW
jgi:hypothetical protein